MLLQTRRIVAEVPVLLQTLQRACFSVNYATEAVSAADATSVPQAFPTPEQQQQQQQEQQQQPTQQQQQQQQAPQKQRQEELQHVLSKLQAKFLYNVPEADKAAPQLPQFLPRTPKPQPLPVLEALEAVKARARARFPETVEVHVRLRVDPRRGDQMVRGAAVLPHSLGKPLRIAVFAEDTAADDAKAAGADVVGSDDLVAQILDSKGKAINFTACLATPDMMPKLVKLGRILGPKGLMPNPKLGTLTNDISSTIAELRRGRVEFKMDRTAIVHAPIGKVTFSTEQLYANIGALTAALLAAKPEVIKGGLPKLVRSVSLASTMGSSVPVEVSSLLKAMDVAAEVLAAQHK